MNKEQQIEEIEQFIYDYVDSKQTEKVYLCSSHVNELSKPFVHNKGIAEALYNAGYRKTFTSDLASDTQKAYKEGYITGIKETESEIELLKADNEALTMWNNASAETIQKLSETNKRFASNMKSVIEIEKKNAVKEFAEKLQKELPCRDYTLNGITFSMILASSMKYVIDKLLKEYEQ